ncbi:MAG TPA: AAA family ATPase [Symbiobacteriaceae bacterium]|jgi:nicotinamide riboside kinase|nr:AAA family ATPase [Symbiobacteriaceae bacterium]
MSLADQVATSYDLVFLCGDEIPYDDAWDRSGDMQRRTFQKQIMADLLMRKVPFIPLSGTLEERVARVKAVLARYRKFENLGGRLRWD